MRNFIKAIEAELERLTNLAMQNNQEKPTFKKEDLMRQLEHCIETGQIKLEYNEESESIIGNIEQWVQDLTDSMAINCRNKIAEKEMMSIFRGYAKKNRISPMKDRVLSEVWDGESRLIKSFPFKYEDTQYNRDIIRNFWINLVARVLNPGCNISQSMVLKGNQGIGKSRFCELVGGDFYVNMDSLNEWNDQNDCMKIRGKMICEFGEMQTTKKNSVDKIKNWLTG